MGLDKTQETFSENKNIGKMGDGIVSGIICSKQKMLRRWDMFIYIFLVGGGKMDVSIFQQ